MRVHRSKCSGQLILRRRGKKIDFQTKSSRGLLRISTLYLRTWMLRVGDNGNAPQARHNISQYFQALAVQFSCHERQASHIAAWMCQGFSEPGNNRISAEDVD